MNSFFIPYFSLKFTVGEDNSFMSIPFLTIFIYNCCFIVNRYAFIAYYIKSINIIHRESRRLQMADMFTGYYPFLIMIIWLVIGIIGARM